MIYYKIILHNEIIGVGNKFTYWNDKLQRYIYCDINKGVYIQNEIDYNFYYTDWLNPIPSGAPEATEVMAIMISAEEYDEIYEQLHDGEEVPYTPPSIQPTPVPDSEPTPEPVPVETPMTIQQMRDKIIEQGQMIDMLTECLLEVSEVIYEE